MTNTNSPIPVKHIAKLANIPISAQDEEKLEKAFIETIKVVDELKKVDVSGVEPTSQVTGLENVWRQDEVDEKHMFSQEEALANAHQKHQGFFVVPQVIDQD